ncbi:MAG: hypothetical protein J7M32_01700, partial [Deltaproteobacteria bacterium]|nr:hypothetical protein [Deltaproteobacteria bacterium]
QGNGGQACPFGIPAFVELRLPPLISHKETAPSRQSRQKNPSAPIYGAVTSLPRGIGPSRLAGT